MPGIFISYRRQDAAHHASRLRVDLAARYGEDRVFFDVIDLAPGADWASQVHHALAASDVMLVVIGQGWVHAQDASGRRRLDDPDDFIRSEVATALSKGKPVVPVLVGGADFPLAEALPEDLQPLARRQAVELGDHRWSSDLERLFRALDPIVGRAPAAPSALPPPPARGTSFLGRLGRAFDVLLGRDAAPPGPAPAPARPARSAPAAATPARPARAHLVFVSHASEDLAVVEQVVQALEQAGLPCWVAYRDIPPGVPSWSEPIVTAIANSKLVLVMLTGHAIGSIEVLREVTLAADEKIPLLPARLDDSPLSPGLRYFFVAGQRLDLSGLVPEDQVRRIVPALTQRLAVAATPSGP